jgi:hypothetical protein
LLLRLIANPQQQVVSALLQVEYSFDLVFLHNVSNINRVLHA